MKTLSPIIEELLEEGRKQRVFESIKQGLNEAIDDGNEKRGRGRPKKYESDIDRAKAWREKQKQLIANASIEEYDIHEFAMAVAGFAYTEAKKLLSGKIK